MHYFRYVYRVEQQEFVRRPLIASCVEIILRCSSLMYMLERCIFSLLTVLTIDIPRTAASKGLGCTSTHWEMSNNQTGRHNKVWIHNT